MREVIPGLIWIGNARDMQNVTFVLNHEILAIVQLAIEEPPCVFPREISYCRFPMLDGAGNTPWLLKTALQTVSTLIRMKVPTLVGCSGGMSRSPAVVAAAISLAMKESPDGWLKKIAASGPHDVAPALWNDLRLCVEASG